MTTRTTQFCYDAVGNRTKVVDPDSRTTYYTYDKVNRLTGISVDPDSKSADYYFDKRGLATTEVKPNSAVTYYEYDDAGRMTKLDNRKSDLSLISSFEYDRDKSGNITKCYRGDTATIYYTYDKAQRLASEVWKDSGMSTVYSYQYDYDGVGNRTKLLRDLEGDVKSIYYYYDAANRLEKEWDSITPATTYFYYNDNGSVTEIVNGSGTTYFEYNDSDLVKKVTRGAVENEFYYDGRNQRVVITDSDGTSYFDWDGINPVEEYGDTDAKYIHGYSPVSGAGSLVYAKRSSDYQIPHKDHIGSTRELSDASEVVTQYYEYDAFGTELEETGSQTNRFQFASSYMKLKDLADVYLSPTRVYHAGIGRFLQKDRQYVLNPFLYAIDSPLSVVDPSGLRSVKWTLKDVRDCCWPSIAELHLYTATWRWYLTMYYMKASVAAFDNAFRSHYERMKQQCVHMNREDIKRQLREATADCVRRPFTCQLLFDIGIGELQIYYDWCRSEDQRTREAPETSPSPEPQPRPETQPGRMPYTPPQVPAAPGVSPSRRPESVQPKSGERLVPPIPTWEPGPLDSSVVPMSPQYDVLNPGEYYELTWKEAEPYVIGGVLAIVATVVLISALTTTGDPQPGIEIYKKAFGY